MISRFLILFAASAAILVLSGCLKPRELPSTVEKPASVAGSGDPVIVMAEDEYPDFTEVPDASGKAYFPEGKASWYTKHLQFMEEPSVQAALPEGATFVLRFTLLPSFTDNLMVRVYDKDGVLHARAVRVKKDPQHHPDRIAEDRRLTLEGESAEQVRAFLASPAIWRPLNGDEEGMAGMDGARWIFERKDASGYHLLSLWSPDYPRASDEILRKAGFDPDQIRDFSPYVKFGRQLLGAARLETTSGQE